MADTLVTELSDSLRQAIAGLEKTEGLEKVGIVTRVGDGVAWVHGLREAGYSEVLEIQTSDGAVEAQSDGGRNRRCAARQRPRRVGWR